MLGLPSVSAVDSEQFEQRSDDHYEQEQQNGLQKGWPTGLLAGKGQPAIELHWSGMRLHRVTLGRDMMWKVLAKTPASLAVGLGRGRLRICPGSCLSSRQSRQWARGSKLR